MQRPQHPRFDRPVDGPDTIYFVQVRPSDLYIQMLYGTKDGVPKAPDHIQVPRDIQWNYSARQLRAVRDEATGQITIEKRDP